MTSHPRDVNVPTPPAPEELAATDALLDRLAARTPDEADLRDPVAFVLAELAAEVDLPTVVVRSEEPAGHDVVAQDPQLSRLLGALGGRPLFLMDDAERTDAGQDAELGAPPEIIVLDDPSWHGTSDVVIDLRDPASHPAANVDDARDDDAGDGSDDSGDSAGDDGNDVAEDDSAPSTVPVPVLAPVPDAIPDAVPAGDTPGPAGPPVPPAQRRPGGARIIPLPVGRWAESHSVDAETLRRAGRHVPLSIAATIAVFTVASGVTAAITGDPLAPITGVTNVVDRFSGNDEAMLVAVQRDITEARARTTAGDIPAAKTLLRQASSNLDEVPARQKPKLEQEIVKVQASIAARAATPATPTTPSVIPPVPTVTPSPTVIPPTPTPTPTDEPSATVTPTDPGPEPTTEPSTPPPTTSPVKPTVTVTVKPTPAKTAP